MGDMMGDLTLLAAFRQYEFTAPLYDGQPHGGLIFKIAHYEGALLNAMRAMLRDRAYDVCEMSPSSYVIAKQAGAPLIGLPVFPFRQYPLGQIVVREDSPITRPEDLRRATIAVRTWAQPTALWARHYLMDYLGVDLSGVRWMFVGQDPVAGVRLPEQSMLRRGESLESLLASGEADAAIGLRQVPAGCRRLIADPDAAAAQWARDTGIVPANHMLVVDARHAGTAVPDLVCARVSEVIRDYLARAEEAPGVIADIRRVTSLAPLPNGRDVNARMWETLLGAMARQGMIEPVAEPMALLHDWNGE
jgi:4,5-dihydroxyphthalate decarboxylase